MCRSPPVKMGMLGFGLVMTSQGRKSLPASTQAAGLVCWGRNRALDGLEKGWGGAGPQVGQAMGQLVQHQASGRWA